MYAVEQKDNQALMYSFWPCMLSMSQGFINRGSTIVIDLTTQTYSLAVNITNTLSHFELKEFKIIFIFLDYMILILVNQFAFTFVWVAFNNFTKHSQSNKVYG